MVKEKDENAGGEVQYIPEIIELFMRNGIKSMTMDDIASHLRVSKKTLYQVVRDKGDLVSKCMAHKFLEHREVIGEITEHHENAIDEIFEVSRFISGELQKIHPSIFYDLEKYYPEAWAAFIKFKNEYVLETISKNLEHGIESGLYRDDINIDIIARLYVGMIDNVLDVDIFPAESHSRPHVYIEMFRYHMRGIASDRGIAYMEKKLTREKDKLN